MKCLSIWFCLIALDMGQASDCDGSKQECTGATISGEKTMVQRRSVHKHAAGAAAGEPPALALVSVAPKSCQVYEDMMEKEDKQLWSGSKKLYDAGAVTGTRAVLKMTKSMASFAVASAGLGFGLGMLGGVVFPDPNQARIENLKSATDCLFDSVEVLQRDVESLKDSVKDNTYLNGLDTSLPLQSMALKLKEQAKSHSNCAQLMKCAADYFFQKNKKDKKDECHDRLEDEEIYEEQSQCDAKAFHEKFLQGGDYIFLKEPLGHFKEYINYTITHNAADMYLFAHSILAEFTNLLTEMYLTQAVVIEWASAICAPFQPKKKYGKKFTLCTSKDGKLVRKGLLAFDKHKKEFVTEAKEFLQSLEEPEFKDQRLKSEVPNEFPEYSGCGNKHIGTASKRIGPVGSRASPRYYFWYRKKYQFQCDDPDSLKEPCEGHSECKVVLDDNPLQCADTPCTFPQTHRDANEMDKCKPQCPETHRYEPDDITCYCDDCGCTNANPYVSYTLIFDHLQQSVKPMQEELALLDEYLTDPPPYQLEEGKPYNVSYKF